MPPRGTPAYPGSFGIDTRAQTPFSPLFGDVQNGPAGINRSGQMMPGLPLDPGLFRMPGQTGSQMPIQMPSMPDEMKRQMLIQMLAKP